MISNQQIKKLMEAKIRSPFTGGIVDLLEREEEITFRGEKIKINRKYYKCRDTGHEFTDSELDDEMMWTVFRKYCELKSPDGHFPRLVEDNDIPKIDGIILDRNLYKSCPGYFDFSEKLYLPPDILPDLVEGSDAKKVKILIIEYPEE